MINAETDKILTGNNGKSNEYRIFININNVNYFLFKYSTTNKGLEDICKCILEKSVRTSLSKKIRDSHVLQDAVRKKLTVKRNLSF